MTDKYQAILGYYPGEISHQRRKAVSQKSDAILITIHDLKNVTEKLIDSTSKQTLQKTTERETLRNLSRAHQSRWPKPPTIEKRAQRRLIDESKKASLDLVYRMEEEAAREKVIERAKEIQFFQRDSVKLFHSKVNLRRTLGERDLQVKMKAKKLDYDEEINRKNKAYQEQKWRQDTLREFFEVEKAKERQRSIAQDQISQINRKKDILKNEREASILEKQTAIENDNRYLSEKKQVAAFHLKESLELQSFLFEQQQELKERFLEQKRVDRDNDQASLQWSERKSAQINMIKQVLSERKEEALAVRSVIGETHQCTNIKENERIENQLKKSLADSEEKFQQLEIKKNLKREEIKKDMESFNKSHKAQMELLAKKRADIVQFERIKSKQIADDDFEKRKLKKAQNLISGKELEQFHLQQMQLKIAKKQEMQVDTAKYHHSKQKELEDDDKGLQAYILNLGKEKWAIGNPLNSRFINNAILEINPKKIESSNIKQVSTADRLGFLPRPAKRPLLQAERKDMEITSRDSRR